MLYCKYEERTFNPIGERKENYIFGAQGQRAEKEAVLESDLEQPLCSTGNTMPSVLPDDLLFYGLWYQLLFDLGNDSGMLRRNGVAAETHGLARQAA